MLPDLDKPSLKEMGITLMGDMIAIIRYAKKVVEETTCKKFLGSSEDTPTQSKNSLKPAPKKVVPKTTVKILSTSKVKPEAPIKVTKANSNYTKPSTTNKKFTPITHSSRSTTQSSRPIAQSSRPNTQSARPTPQSSRPISQSSSRLYSDYVDSSQRLKTSSLKRKYDSDEEGINGKWMHNETSKRFDDNDNLKFSVMMPKGITARSPKMLKMDLEHNRTVFHRLGDSMVSSTTNIPEAFSSHYNPTFNVVGLEKDYFKRNSSVFRRLGNKDDDEPT